MPDLASSPWIAPVFLVHMGCPHRCVFCNQNRITNVSAPSPDEVGKRLKACFTSRKKESSGRRQIAFYGGSFTAMPRPLQKAYLDQARPYLLKGEIDSIRISTRPDALSESQVAFVAEQGVNTIEIGIQSLSDSVLSACRRGYTRKQVIEGIRQVKARGMEIGAQVMIGLPKDTGAESLKTAKLLCTYRPDFVRIYPLLVFRDTVLADMLGNELYQPLSLEAAVSLCLKMVKILENASIPVIRIGLQEQAGMRSSENTVLAGPYHPAFGHLVRCAGYLEKVLAALPSKHFEHSKLILRIHPHDRPLLIGDRKQNIQKLTQIFQGCQLSIEEDGNLRRGEVQCISSEDTRLN